MKLDKYQVKELQFEELQNESGGIAIFLVAFGIGWMIAHHQAVNEGRCK